MFTVVLFILILSLLVFVHEFGHFLAARKTGMKVHEFAIGFPPMAIGVYRDPATKKFVFVRGKSARALLKAGGGEETVDGQYPATLYSLNWLPLGGFCKIKGENGEQALAPDSFGYQKTWKKVLVLVAGVSMNFLLAAVVLGIGFLTGLPTDTSAGVPRQATLVQSSQVFIQQVESGSPAEQAGIRFGDRIVGFNGTELVQSQDLVRLVGENPGVPIELTLNREDQEVRVTIQTAVVKEGENPRLGVVLADVAVVRYPWYLALYKGFEAAFWGLIGIFVSFYLLLKSFVLGNGLAFEVSGPVGIATLIGDSARLGWHYLLNITAMISLSLAAINILPIPALDGGRLLFVLIEKAIGRPVSKKYEQAAHTIGFVLLMALIVVVTFRDVRGLIQ